MTVRQESERTVGNCSLLNRHATRKRPAILRAPKRAACRYASIWFCQGLGDHARRTDSAR